MATAAYSTQTRYTLVKKHTTSDDPVPTVSDVVYLEAPAVILDTQTVTTNEATGSLDAGLDIFAGGTGRFTGTVNAKGSGTAGAEPDWSPLAEACGLKFTNFAADVTGTAQAGATRSVTLASGASAVDNFYRGQVVQLTAGTGSTGTPFRIIAAYNGTTKVATVYPAWGVAPDNTTTYNVRKGTKFEPTSTSLALAAIYDYQHRNDGGESKLRKVLNAAGNVRITLGVRAAMQLAFEMRGSLELPDDVTHPGAATIENQVPPIWFDGTAHIGDIESAIRQITIDLGNEVSNLDDPNEQFGFGGAQITRRRINSTLSMPQLLESELDAANSALNGTEQLPITATFGKTAGNRIAVMLDRSIFTNPGTTEEQNNFIYQNLTIRPAGQDTGIRMFIW